MGLLAQSCLLRWAPFGFSWLPSNHPNTTFFRQIGQSWLSAPGSALKNTKVTPLGQCDYVPNQNQGAVTTWLSTPGSALISRCLYYKGSPNVRGHAQILRVCIIHLCACIRWQSLGVDLRRHQRKQPHISCQRLACCLKSKLRALLLTTLICSTTRNLVTGDIFSSFGYLSTAPTPIRNII